MTWKEYTLSRRKSIIEMSKALRMCLTHKCFVSASYFIKNNSVFERKISA